MKAEIASMGEGESSETFPNGLYSRRRLLKLGAAGAAAFLTACAKKAGVATSTTTMGGVAGPATSSGGTERPCRRQSCVGHRRRRTRWSGVRLVDQLERTLHR